MSYAPNTIAAGLLIDHIYPVLKAMHPECRLLLVGRVPTAKMLKAADQDADIVVTGSVPDVRPYLAAASIMVVPLQQGGGTRLKILEAFASGCLLLALLKGLRGSMPKMVNSYSSGTRLMKLFKGSIRFGRILM